MEVTPGVRGCKQRAGPKGVSGGSFNRAKSVEVAKFREKSRPL